MLHVLGQKICVVSTTDVAMDLFNVRALNYSERPRMPMVRELYVLLLYVVTITANKADIKPIEWAGTSILGSEICPILLTHQVDVT